MKFCNKDCIIVFIAMLFIYGTVKVNTLKNEFKLQTKFGQIFEREGKIKMRNIREFETKYNHGVDRLPNPIRKLNLRMSGLMDSKDNFERPKGNSTMKGIKGIKGVKGVKGIKLFTNPNSESSDNSLFFKKLIKLLYIYFQIFIIFSIISMYKWYEEMLKIKYNFIENKFSNFEDLTIKENNNNKLNSDKLNSDKLNSNKLNSDKLNSNKLNSDKLNSDKLNSDKLNSNQSEFDDEGKYVFASGKCDIKVPAQDTLFNFSYTRDYAVVERRVDYFHKDKNKWYRLGNNNNHNHNLNRDQNLETFTHNLDMSMPEITFINENYLQLNFHSEVYTFPRILSTMFLGQVEVQSIRLNQKQLKNLTKSETIKFGKENLHNVMKEFPGLNGKVQQMIAYEFSEDFIIIYPCDIENENSKESLCKIRVSLNGYPCEKISIMSQIKNGSFKTIHIPHDQKLDTASDHTSYINNSTNMIVAPNFNIDFFNLLFCLCLSGPATYNYKDTLANEPDCFLAKINWVEEKEMSKIDLIKQKHHISTVSSFLTRLTIFLILVACFNFFPDSLIYIFQIFNIPQDTIQRHLIKYSLFSGKLIISLVYIYTMISYKSKHFINMFFLASVVLLMIILVTREVFIFK